MTTNPHTTGRGLDSDLVAVDEPYIADVVDPLDMPLHGIGDLALALNGSPDSFTGELLKLIPKAQATPANYATLRVAFPRLVRAWELWVVPPRNNPQVPLTSRQLLAALDTEPWPIGTGQRAPDPADATAEQRDQAATNIAMADRFLNNLVDELRIHRRGCPDKTCVGPVVNDLFTALQRSTSSALITLTVAVERLAALPGGRRLAIVPTGDLGSVNRAGHS